MKACAGTQQGQGKAETLQAEIEQANKTMAGLKEDLATAKAETDRLRESRKVTDDETFGFAHMLN